MRARAFALALVIFATTGLGCRGPDDDRPVILVVVIDTLRRDAVSAYGEVAGTTPVFDRLAAEGILYRHAFAPSPWTLPSHATLFTGLSPIEHGVGLAGRMTLPGGSVTLAERLREVGYRTLGLSENPLISAPFGMTRGFDLFEGKVVYHPPKPGAAAPKPFDVLVGLESQLARLDRDAPFFVFVNLFDAHEPYSVREQNPFVDPQASLGEIRHAASLTGRIMPLCERLPARSDLKIIRALYHADVQSADRKLGRIVERVTEAAGDRTVVSLVTSDHGEHFGEHRLMGHEYSLRGEVLDIPLVVHGLPRSADTIVQAPVGLDDVFASVLCLARTGDCTEGLPFVPSYADRQGGLDDLVAVYSDEKLQTPEVLERYDVHIRDINAEIERVSCAPSDPVHGRMVALLRWPLKLIWYENNYPPELYDLSWDPSERSDLRTVESQQLAAMASRTETLLDRADALPEATAVPGAAKEALRALGYVD